MPYVIKSAEPLSVHPGEVIHYTYIVINNDILFGIEVNFIEDTVLGIVWSGSQGIPFGGSEEFTFDKIADCTTITNKARANYNIPEISENNFTEFSNEITVICTPVPTWKDIAQAINTKEDSEILNALMQGNHTHEEIHALRCVKYAKIIDLI